LEQTFGITFDVDELMEMENVREIVRIVSAKLSRKA
jgi:acyl carrier protein